MPDHWRLCWRPFSLWRWRRDGQQGYDQGLQVELEDPRGRQAAGEISPLPERGRSGADPLHGGHLEALRRQLEPLDATEGRRRLDHWLRHMACGHPCTAFALGSALWRLEQQRHRHNGPPRPDGTGGNPAAEPAWPTVGILPAGPPALTALERGLARGWRCWKWKIGALPWRQEQPLLAALLSRLASVEGELRLDANGRLKAAELAPWLEAAADPRIRWLEQPLAPEGSTAGAAAVRSPHPRCAVGPGRVPHPVGSGGAVAPGASQQQAAAGDQTVPAWGSPSAGGSPAGLAWSLCRFHRF